MNKIKIDNYYKPESKTLRLDEIDYTIIPNSDIKPLLDKLQQENKILKENAEHNDKVVDKVNWENQLLKKENKQLKERIGYLERSNNRREDTILEQRQNLSDLEDNWIKLRKYIKTEIPEDVFIDTEWFVSILDKMTELEKGSDINVKD